MYTYIMGIFNTGYNDEKTGKKRVYSITYFESVLMRIKLFMEMPSKFIYKKKILKLNDLDNFSNVNESLILYKSDIGILFYLPYFSCTGNASFIMLKLSGQIPNIKKNTNYQLITILNTHIGTDKEKILNIGIRSIYYEPRILKNGIVKLKINFTTNDDITDIQVYLHLCGTTTGANLKPSDLICVLFWGIKEF